MDDKLILYSFIAAFSLNAVLAAQMVYYWNAPSAKLRGKQKERVEAKPLLPGAPSLTPVAPAAFPSTSAATTPNKSKGPTTRRRG